jgi:hypothetical protein
MLALVHATGYLERAFVSSDASSLPVNPAGSHLPFGLPFANLGVCGIAYLAIAHVRWLNSKGFKVWKADLKRPVSHGAYCPLPSNSIPFAGPREVGKGLSEIFQHLGRLQPIAPVVRQFQPVPKIIRLSAEYFPAEISPVE